MKPILERVLPSLLLSLSVTSCGASSANSHSRPYQVQLRASSDEGEPVAGAEFRAGGKLVGKSDPNGAVGVTMRGAEGEQVRISVVCPDGYVGPEQPSTLKLTELRRVDQSGPSTLGVELTCTRKLRDVVVVVRTTNAPSLPVDIAGKTMARTDPQGNAHVHLQVDRDVSMLSVSLGTKDASLLRPQNPSRVFELDGRDAVLLLEQAFTSERKSTPRRIAVVAKQQQHVPYQIRSGR